MSRRHRRRPSAKRLRLHAKSILAAAVAAPSQERLPKIVARIPSRCHRGRQRGQATMKRRVRWENQGATLPPPAARHHTS